METAEARVIRARLEELLSLALAYRGWNTRQLAATLDRCAGNVIPDSGLPKLDLVIHLANVLDWPLDAVIAHLSGELAEPRPMREAGQPTDAPALATLGAAALAAGDPARAARLARSSLAVATCPGEVAAAAALEAEAWAVEGRWDRVIPLLQRAIEQPDETPESPHAPARPPRAELLARLARAYHRTGLWLEGGAVSSLALEAARQGDARTLTARAEALCLRALCVRDRLECLGMIPDAEVTAALRDSQACSAILGWPVVSERFAQTACLRSMAAATSLELRAYRAELSGPIAVAQVLEGLEPWIDVEAATDRAGLAGAGWWSVIGFAVAARHLVGPTRHQSLAILSNKADEIAGAVGCWALRERVLRMEFERRELAALEGAAVDEWVLDEEDLHVIVGCIGASRRFRTIGMDILRRATFVMSDRM